MWGQASGLVGVRATLRLEKELFLYVIDGYCGGWSMEWHVRERQLRRARTGSMALESELRTVLLYIKPGLALYALKPACV